MGAREELDAALAAEERAIATREQARLELEELEGRRQATAERAMAAGTGAAGLRGRLDAIHARISEEEGRGIARAARRRGGRRLDEELGVDPNLRAAVEAALGDAVRGYLVGAEAVAELVSERGLLVVDRPDGLDADGAEMPRTLRDRLVALGGGPLVEAIRRDPSGAARRLLATAVWVPDVTAALELQPLLPPGWIAVGRDGAVVAGRVTIALGRADAPLERRAEADRLAGQVEAAEAVAATAASEAEAVEGSAARARVAFEQARSIEATAASRRRRAEEDERRAGRATEAVAREAGWLEAQVARLETETERHREALATLVAAATSRRPTAAGASNTGIDATALATWEGRVTELRGERDRFAEELAEGERRRREAESRRARAEATVAMDEDRIARADEATAALVDRERGLVIEGERLDAEVAAAVAREGAARVALDELRAADVSDRERLAAAEKAAADARDRLRTAEDRLRTAEVADLEARLGLDAIREQLLVELASLGDLGLRSLGVEGPVDDETVALEGALQHRASGWAADVPAGEPPAPGRVAYLRRRYHELGAANPFAVDEYATLRARLETLEGQDADLRSAISRTRSLIEDLNVLIAEQFQSTFRALESAFDGRFQQLFGGGFARLSLTDPNDLSATGVEIVARPPGKKAQALAMLSGGERALTAVALLFAMLEVRPVPFCVLDEVDAALDEANIGRFSDALQSLAHRTQFIVITHNRGTIEIADALYGVTVGDDSVSQVISLRLEEAQTIAERRGSGSAELLAG